MTSQLIRFTHPKVVDFLLNGAEYVATMRRYPKKIGEITILIGKPAKQKLVGEVVDNFQTNPETIRHLLKYSGFSDPLEWLVIACRLHNYKFPKYIVLIKINEGLQKVHVFRLAQT